MEDVVQLLTLWSIADQFTLLLLETNHELLPLRLSSHCLYLVVVSFLNEGLHPL